MITSGIEHEPIHFTCPECGCVDEVQYNFKPSNNALQARCVCGKWIGNVKYDKRSQEEIRLDKIKDWMDKKNNQEVRHNADHNFAGNRV